MNIVTSEQMRSLLAQAPANPRVVATGNHVPPWALLKVIDEALPEYRLNMLNAPAGISTREGVSHESCFVGVGMRKLPTLHYTPARLSLVPALFRSTMAPDITAVHVSQPINGKVSLGVEINVMVAAIEAVKERGGLLVAQVNKHMPYTYGDGEFPVDLFDAFIEADESIASEHGPAAPDAATAHIGELVAGRVGNGATLQLGIGAVPDATLPGLARRHDLGIWTEMFSDGVLTLDRSGALDDTRPIVASFAFGSQELYDWCHLNSRVIMRRTEITNDPGQIAKQPQMTSINTALQVDLLSQANASRIKARIHSGFGGQTDFIVGALHSRGGQAMMALRSWHPKANVSTIVPMLTEPTTSFQHSAVITEHGVAEVFGHEEKVQARNIIENAAHPDVRESLWEGARELGLA
ncbi:acetyl-CoA hydrolase/transferase family protein [Arsenicicoccus dermatophilus]|uniref:acetyl-CoA hydrolase/transferase family protein n=1 Tax=Arsenicicoccus dermatophilus TaxID=1076331 RepID=UPI001F4C9535|nr:acetyl-CoA hydrolase/transferase C-terminal domain-containing protein [Arsenicicoccus dermatophilus]MCH8613376.1 acetyl-CoA hydrolase [Arsenicicoccus dermatophilus]